MGQTVDASIAESVFGMLEVPLGERDEVSICQLPSFFSKNSSQPRCPQKTSVRGIKFLVGGGGGVAKYDVKCCLKADENLYTILFLQDFMTLPDLT